MGVNDTMLNWQWVPFDDPVCRATQWGTDTPNNTFIILPYSGFGLNGTPYSGDQFLSGLHAGRPEDNFMFQEGIMQTVGGLIPDSSYQIRLFQSVVKQYNCLDRSGSWVVYMDSVEIGVTTPSYSELIFHTNDLNWDRREFVFIATDTAHTFKFLPLDDDTILVLNERGAGGLRMGIDSISLWPHKPCDSTFLDLGPDTSLCQSATLLLAPDFPEGVYEWQDGSTDPVFQVFNPGVYTVEIDNRGCIYQDSITISPDCDCYFVESLGNDTTICFGESITLRSGPRNASYLWQDGSINASYVAPGVGTYWVTASLYGCTSTDTLSITPDCDCFPKVELGTDAALCEGESYAWTLPQIGASYLWQDSSTSAGYTAFEAGTYQVWMDLAGCVSSDSVTLSPLDCEVRLEMPNVFTPNGDGINEIFTPMEINGIQSLHTQIFDRWGRQVFSSHSLDIEWNGKQSGNSIAQSGTYFWVLQYVDRDGVQGEDKGTVTLIR